MIALLNYRFLKYTDAYNSNWSIESSIGTAVIGIGWEKWVRHFLTSTNDSEVWWRSWSEAGRPDVTIHVCSRSERNEIIYHKS